LDELYLTDDKDIRKFVDDQRALLIDVKDEALYKEIKMNVKEMYLSQKKENKPGNNDSKGKDSNKNKGKGK